MDKRRIVEIAQEIARRNEEKLGHNNPQHVRLYGEPVRMIKLIDGGINEFVAAILLEAAKVCEDTAQNVYYIDTEGGCLMCRNRLQKLAKELTQ